MKRQRGWTGWGGALTVVLVAPAGALAIASVVLATTVAAATGQGSTVAAGGGDPPAAAVAGIPAPYPAALTAAAARFAVPWSVLAGIYRVECDFGASALAGCPRGTENSAGAQGPGQFLAPTWRRSLPPHALIGPGPPAPAGAGMATDGDGDGVADAWDPFDAVASTARMLASDGAATDLRAAIFSYNHDPSYVAEVLALAAGYQEAGAPATGGAPASAAVASVVAFATSQLGRPYLWGGASPGGWDCSGLVEVALDGVGIHLEHNAAAQYAATASTAVPLGALRPGDLVFYGASPATIHHVGIAIDSRRMIDAPDTGSVVRVDPVAAADLLAATRPLP